MTIYLIVAGMIRRGDDVLLVRQQGPEDPRAHWALPGGRGEIACADPDCFVSEAEFVPLPEAIRRLGELPFPAMREPAIAHLSGTAEPCTLWVYRRGKDGEDLLEDG